MAQPDRVVILLDESVFALEAGLKVAGFKVLPVKHGMTGDEIKYLARQTLVVTSNSADFEKDAIACDYDVLSLEHLKFIDTLPTGNKTVGHIVKAIQESEIGTRRGNFKLTLKDGEQGETEWHLEVLWAQLDKIPILLDENVFALKAGLEVAGFKVLTVMHGMTDDTIKELAKGTFVATRNSADFETDAVRCDYDVLSLEHLKFIDAQQAGNKAVDHIVEAIRESDVFTRRGNYKLILMDGEQGETEWRLERIYI